MEEPDDFCCVSAKKSDAAREHQLLVPPPPKREARGASVALGGTAELFPRCFGVIFTGEGGICAPIIRCKWCRVYADVCVL